MHTESLFVEVNKSIEFFMAAKKRLCLDLNIKLHEVFMSGKVMITPAPPSKHSYTQKQM